MELLKARHRREVEKLLREIIAFRARPREACDYLLYDGFAAQFKAFRNLEISPAEVDRVEEELNLLALEIFEGVIN